MHGQEDLVFNDLVSRANLISMMTVLLLQGIYDEYGY